MAGGIDALCCSLERLDQRAPLARLVSLLKEHDICCDDVANFLRFRDRTYTRNLVRGGKWYDLWVLCWQNGQRSPIHDHQGSSCGVRVLRGTATQTLFRFAPNGHVMAVGSEDLAEGSVIASQDDDMHQISNLQAGGRDLVTLHIYSPPLVRMNTFSLYDLTRGEDFMSGEGI